MEKIQRFLALFTLPLSHRQTQASILHVLSSSEQCVKFFFCIIHCQCNLICSLNFPESLSLFSNFYTKCLALLIFCIGWFSKLPRLFQIREHFSLLCLLLEYCFFDIPLYTILWATINWSLVFLLSICSFLLSICKPWLLKSTFLWQNNIF